MVTDKLLIGVENANDLLGDKGLMKEVKVRLMERMLGVELTEVAAYEYPSWSSGVLRPFSVFFDQCVCELDEFAHDCCQCDLWWFAFCDHVLVFGAHIGVVFGRDESWQVERVAQRFSSTLNARFSTPLS